MNEQNVQASVLRALKAYKLEKGLSDSAATAFATAKLSEGMTRARAIMAQHRLDPEGGIRAAFADLKTWAQS